MPLASFLSRRAALGVAALASLTFAALTAPAARAQTIGDPIVYNYTGVDQLFVVPADVTQLQVRLFGAGGASGGQGGNGGGGGYAAGTLSVTAGDILTLIVGQGGQNGNSGGSYGGGGAAAGGPNGGGRSGIRIGGVEVITAGAGGGGIGSSGGAGGGLTGADGSGPIAGTGGTQTAGGGSGTAAGSMFQGGRADGQNTLAAGGGGYYGGGAGFTTGGGGSSFISSSALVSGTGETLAGERALSGGRTSTDYRNGIGVGGNNFGNSNGGNGLIVIRTVTPTAAVAAPEPGTIALLLTAGVPVVGIVLRRKKH